MNKLLWKLIRLQISPWQLAGFALANVLGMTVVLFGVQFYLDAAPVFTAGDSFMKEEYIVVTKEVGLSGITGKNSPGFSTQEMESLAAQPFVDDCAPFTSANFGVVASIQSASAGVGFQTEMFLEALPDKYIDTDLKNWHYTPGSNQVPIVIPRNYLNLYNFGFAAGRGLPAISETVVGMVPIQLYLSGAKGNIIVEGHVTGFSNRLNTILVPIDFMRMANDSIAEKNEAKSTRICLNVKNPADPAIGEYLSQHGYRTEGTGGDTGRMAYFLRLICVAVVGVGICICVLAFFVMLLSVFLLLQKNMEKARTLRLIGYKVSTVCLPYFSVVLLVYTLGFIVSVVALSMLRNMYMHHFIALNPQFSVTPNATIYILALLLSAMLAALAAFAIWHKMKRST